MIEVTERGKKVLINEKRITQITIAKDTATEQRPEGKRSRTFEERTNEKPESTMMCMPRTGETALRSTDGAQDAKIEYVYKGDGTYGLSEKWCILGMKKEPIVFQQNGNGNYQINNVGTLNL